MATSSSDPAEIAPITTPRLEWEDARVSHTPLLNARGRIRGQTLSKVRKYATD